MLPRMPRIRGSTHFAKRGPPCVQLGGPLPCSPPRSCYLLPQNNLGLLSYLTRFLALLSQCPSTCLILFPELVSPVLYTITKLLLPAFKGTANMAVLVSTWWAEEFSAGVPMFGIGEDCQVGLCSCPPVLPPVQVVLDSAKPSTCFYPQLSSGWWGVDDSDGDDYIMMRRSDLSLASELPGAVGDTEIQRACAS